MANPVQIIDYSTLSDSVSSYLENEDLLSSDISLFVQLAEADFRKDVRLDLMIKSSALGGTLASGVAEFAEPTDFIETVVFTVENTSGRSRVLEYMDPRSFYEAGRNTVSGFPMVYTRLGGVFQLGPIPDAAYVYSLVYYGNVLALVPSVPTSSNALLLKEPNLYLYAVLKKATEFFSDDGATQKWSSFYEATKAALQSADARARYRPGLRERKSGAVDDGAFIHYS